MSNEKTVNRTDSLPTWEKEMDRKLRIAQSGIDAVYMQTVRPFSQGITLRDAIDTAQSAITSARSSLSRLNEIAEPHEIVKELREEIGELYQDSESDADTILKCQLKESLFNEAFSLMKRRIGLIWDDVDGLRFASFVTRKKIVREIRSNLAEIETLIDEAIEDAATS